VSVQQQLDDDRRATLRRLAALTRDLEVLMTATADTPDDEHDPEGSTIGFERAQVIALVASARQHLWDIEAAESRLQAGIHHICERCGGSIAPARLEARPTARTCVACAELGGPSPPDRPGTVRP
jgi:DnaK suppressor protein